MATAKITTLTPVHIGNGEKLLRDFDFIIRDGRVGFLDLEKVVAQLGIERLPQLTAEIERKNVSAFLKKALPSAALEDLCSRTVKANGHITSSTGELKSQYRTALQGPCIPGSSIKGSMRTAMTTYLTSAERNNEAKQSELLRSVNWTGKVNFGRLDQELFGNTANAKSTRFLTVGDVQFQEKDVEVLELGYINQLGNGAWEYEIGKLQLVECLKKGVTTNFELKLNLALAEMYKAKRKQLVLTDPMAKSMAPLKDLSFFGADEAGFLTNINVQTKILLQWDIQKLKDLDAESDLIEALEQVLNKAEACTSGEAVLRVGGHNGWHYMTGRWMMYSERVFKDEMFDSMQNAAQRNNRYLGLQFPKTRKMTDDGLPLGFVKIEL